MQNKAVDRRANTRTPVDRWRSRATNWLKRPPVPVGRVVVCICLNRPTAVRSLRQAGTLTHPRFQYFDFPGRQTPVRRHLSLRRVSNGLNQQTLIDLSRNDRSTRRSAPCDSRSGCQGQTVLGIVRSVALSASPDEQRSHLTFEKICVSAVPGRRGAQRSCRKQDDQQDPCRYSDTNYERHWLLKADSDIAEGDRRYKAAWWAR